MLDTLPDYVYNVKQYLKFSWDELVGFLVTSLFGAFIITFNDWGEGTFELAVGLRTLLAVFVFLLLALAFTVLLCKLYAVRVGYEMTYRPHLIGMMFGLVLVVASAGFLPIFVPGGYDFKRPVRRYAGHWRGYHRPWEIAMIAGWFPMLFLAYVLVLSPLYLMTGSFLVYKFIVACCLVAVYSLIPAPNVALEYGGRVLDFFRYLKGMTFGLQIVINSRTWFVALGTFTILSSILAYVVTVMGSRVGFILYVLAFIIGLVLMFLYKSFWEEPAFGSTFR